MFESRAGETGPSGRPLLHVDADCFFAAVALRGRPDLARRPVAVVNHMFVASANYPARRRGVRGGTTVAEAVHACPGLVLLDVPHAEVEEVSDALFGVFHRFAAAVEPGSVEEAFLDVRAGDWGEAARTAQTLRAQVLLELGVTVSVGVGRTKLMAKLASRAAKPDGLHLIEPHHEAELRAGLPISRVWGIGPKTLTRLANLDVHRLADLDRVPREAVQRLCGTTMARRLTQIRNGTDDAVVRPVQHRESLSAEVSTEGYARPDHTPAAMARLCTERVLRRAEKAGLSGTGILLTLQPRDGGRPERRRQSGTPGDGWVHTASALLEREPVPPLAGLRVTLTGLAPAGQEPETLF
ncbi:DNA polymerase Y family protein [Kineosporia succinea]|uniref:DNA polymerase-4 n=1 Tax=Kineosporia succinea TaxID=84632 RepID=A0ABT9PFM7_9ACTN|nr:DNA polymerase IV [Kineosporia succinea]MDP9831194.1 DNA polymerase-4 [Kineosporia succinea]